MSGWRPQNKSDVYFVLIDRVLSIPLLNSSDGLQNEKFAPENTNTTLFYYGH